MKKLTHIFSLLLLSTALITVVSCNEKKPTPTLNPDFQASHELKSVVSAIYSTEEGKGVYSIQLASGDLDAAGYPANVGDIYFTINLYAELDKDPLNAALPNGTYLSDTTAAPMTWIPSANAIYVRVEEGAGYEGTTLDFMTAGTIWSYLDGDNYTLQISFTTSGGTVVDAQYVGPIIFQQGGTSGANAVPFEEDQNVTFESARAQYYGNWMYPFADDITLYLSSNVTDKEGTVTASYGMTIFLYMDKLEDYTISNPRIQDGTYKIDPRKHTMITAMPMTLQRGETGEVMGTMMSMGTTLHKTDFLSGKSYLGLMMDGTMEVKTINGDEYQIDINLVTVEGIKLTASYTGAIEIPNKNNTDVDPAYPGDTQSTLEADFEMNIPNGKNTAMFVCLGEYIVPGLNTWMLYLGIEEYEEYFTTWFFTPLSETTSFKFTKYPVNKSLTEYTMLPGFYPYGGGELYFSWFGDLSKLDDEGYATVLARLVEGSMNIIDAGKDESGAPLVTLELDFKDDKGNKVFGDWTGPLNISDPLAPTTAKAHLLSK